MKEVAAPTCAHCDLPVPRDRVAGRDGGAAAPTRLFCCFGCRIAFDLASGSGNADDGGLPNTLLLRLGIGIFLTMNIMVFSWLHYSRELLGTGGTQHEALAALFAYLLMFLGTAVVVALGGSFLDDALAGPSLTRPSANLLICVGVTAAYVVSVVNTIRGHGSLYYDTAAIILVLVTLGHYLDSRARLRASRAARELLAAVPERAWVADGDGLDLVEERDVTELAIGARVRVRPGETIPVDGVVGEGHAAVDESALTGESQPRTVGPGDPVHAGSIALDGQLWLTTTVVSDERAIARLQRLLDEARRGQPPLQSLADAISAVFVPLVVILAIAVFGYWAAHGNSERGLFDALSVLLISCPCALGLSGPLATWSALRRAARHGILIDSPATLERAARVDRAFFDKTGTLTERRFQLDAIVVEPDARLSEDAVLAIAAAIEQASTHPVAAAIVAAANQRALPRQRVTSARVLPGQGIEGCVGEVVYRVGGERILNGGGTPTDPSAEARIYLLAGERRLARFALTERVRADAASTIDQLAALGVRSRILTGDHPAAADRVARHLGIPAEASLLPGEKVERLRAARHTVGTIAMVGDGINDAAVLAAADVGFGVADATDLAKQAGNVRLLSDRLDRVPLTLAIARHTIRRIRWNLAWSFTYNTIGLGLAATGKLTPIFAVTAMFASSAFVVHNSSAAGRVAAPAASDSDPTANRAPIRRPAVAHP